ncbi:MAG: hypothetical protein ACJ72N_23180 [Labedaea sp.]
MFRPLSQRIRESAPVRLVAGNRLVRRIADRPVTSAPTRGQAVLVGLVPALAAALTLTGFLLLAPYHPGAFGILGLLSIAVVLLGGLLIGARLRSVLCTLIMTGLYFVFIVAGAAPVVGEYLLTTRGEQVTAVVGPTVTNPTGCAAASAFFSRDGGSIARSVHRPDGSPLPGAIGLGDQTHGNRHTYRPGERVEVLVDPANEVCMRAKSDVHLVVDSVVTVLAFGCIAVVFLVAALDWRLRRRERYEAWRARAH